ncbi:unnamed protein product [Moneuplotes crassus]|uniref:EGF-like domain-containing protein n=1 Tax=Euplotes crassus TaxID=5936 RepID=A0AAD1XIK5_EUPCR|nr:unnamed protein product [Moneuplotes crassus]
MTGFTLGNKEISGNWRTKGLICFYVLCVVFIEIGRAQHFGNQERVDGFAHYINYDDYIKQDEESDKPQNPILKMKPNHKIWKQDSMYIPELIMEDPYPREGSVAHPLNKPPCGSTKRGMVYYSAYPGRSNLIRWKVIHPILEGNCTIKLSNGLDQSHETAFEPLEPVYDFSFQNEDGSLDYYSGDTGNYYRQFYHKGKFSCGRVDPETYESITVKFPNMTCDDCVLQLEVETKQGKIYQCADIEVINAGMRDCVGSCLNEGVCVNGKCLCRSGFVGQHCENKTQEKRTYTPWFAIIGLIIFAIIVAVVVYISCQFVSQKERWISLTRGSRKSRIYPSTASEI